MITARERVAALRSKRLAQESVQKQSTDVPINEGKQQDFNTPSKSKIEGTASEVKRADGSASSTPVGKILTPTHRRFRNDMRAARLQWRQDQLRHARKVAVQNAIKSDAYTFMTAPVPDEEKTPVNPAIKPDLSQSAHDGGMEQGDDLADPDDDEEDGDYNIEDDVDDEKDEEERALQSAEQQDLHHDESSTLDAHDFSTSREFVDTYNCKSGEEGNTDSREKAPRDFSVDNPVSADSNHIETETQVQKVSNQEVSESDPPTSQPCHLGPGATLDGTSNSSSLKHADSGGSTERNVDGSSGPLLLPCPFIDQEAEEDEGEHHVRDEENNSPHPFDEEDVCIDDDNGEHAIVPDERPSKADAVAIASFHRQWEMQQEQDQVAILAASTKRRLVDDFDEAVDLSCVTTTITTKTIADGKPDVAGGETAEGGENVCSNDSNGGTKKDSTAEYLEAMFRRDDSTSKVLDDEICKENDDIDKREQQRALWKARLRKRQEFEDQDENSLSHFDLFKSGTKSRNDDIRKKIENACRSASANPHVEVDKNKERTKGGLKRLAVETDETHEWLKQKTYLERRQQKRQRAISVAKWSFDAQKGSDKPQPKPSKGSSNAHTSLGASHLIRKNRTVEIRHVSAVVESTKKGRTRPDGSRRPKPPASFKGLLSILGQQAQADSR